MSTRDKEWIKYALLVAVIVVAGYFGVRYPLPEMPEYIPPEDIEDMELYAVAPTRFRAIYVDHDATVGGTITGDVTGDLTGDVTGNVAGNVTGDLTGDVAGDLTNSTFLDLTAQTAISVTAAGVITPTGTYQPLTSAAAVTTSTTCAIYTSTVTGRLLILENQNITDTITIDGTGGNVECKANIGLAPKDTLWLWWNGTDWLCLSGYDNS